MYNRTPEKAQELVSLGATLAPTPRQVAQQCDITFSMVSDPAAAREVALGEYGVVTGLSSGKGTHDAAAHVGLRRPLPPLPPLPPDREIV